MTKRHVYRQNPEEAERRLDPYLREAKVGIPDEDLATLAGVAKKSVIMWRLKNQIRRKNGHLRKQERNQGTIAANLFGAPLPDILQRVQTSPVFGMWSPPNYALRTGIDYDSFLEQVYTLHEMFGYSESSIASAFGMTKKTVQDALAIYTEWLIQNGATCLSCGFRIPPGKDYCSKRCSE